MLQFSKLPFVNKILVMRLNAERSTRISALQSTFPLSQYFILVAIGSSICLAFLIETNQEILIFLNAFQLRILWTMLIGLMSTLCVLCYDLSDPFRGIFTIESALKQLYIIRVSAIHFYRRQSTTCRFFPCLLFLFLLFFVPIRCFVSSSDVITVWVRMHSGWVRIMTMMIPHFDEEIAIRNDDISIARACVAWKNDCTVNSGTTAADDRIDGFG